MVDCAFTSGVGEEHSNGDDKAADKWKECIKKKKKQKEPEQFLNLSADFIIL